MPSHIDLRETTMIDQGRLTLKVDEIEDLLIDAIVDLPLTPGDLHGLRAANEKVLAASNRLTALIIEEEEEEV